MSNHGLPCWFELSVPDLDAAQEFYAPLMGWAWSSAGMEGLDYRLASAGKDMVAGGFPISECPPGTPPNWMIYIAVDDVDATAKLAEELRGKIWKAPADIPGTGRFAVLGDPQGAVFGILEPLPMDPPPEGGAWNQRATGHGNWLELMSSDPRASLEFYRRLFDWRRDADFDIGPLGQYYVFAHRGVQIGGMMGLGPAPVSNWLAYFGVNALDAAVAQVKASGGVLLNGPVEVPGPAFVARLRDPQGAHFALVAPKR